MADNKTGATNLSVPPAAVPAGQQASSKASTEEQQDSPEKSTADKKEAAANNKGAKAKMLKAIGAKEADVMGFNAETNTLATWQGGKYRLSKDGKKLIHLMGPVPGSKQAKMSIEDADKLVNAAEDDEDE